MYWNLRIFVERSRVSTLKSAISDLPTHSRRASSPPDRFAAFDRVDVAYQKRFNQ